MRRENNSGTFIINKNKDGKVTSYTLRVQYGVKPDGKQNFKSFNGKTKRAAMDKKKIYEAKLGKGSEGAKVLFGPLFERYMNNVKTPKNTPQTTARDWRTANLRILPIFEKWEISEITADDIQTELINYSMSQGFSHSEIKKSYDLMNSFLRYCTIQNIIIKNPMEYNAVQLPNKKLFTTKEIRALTDLETTYLLDESKACYANNVRKHKNAYEFIVFAINTGLRQGEISALKWDAVDLKNKKIFVKRNLSEYTDKDNTTHFKINSYAKTSKSHRSIYLNDAAIEVLKILQREAERKKSKYVFSTRTGNYLIHSNISKSITTIKKAVLEKQNYDLSFVTPHVFRHTFAANLFKNGVDLPIIQKLLGHESIKITVDTYIGLFSSIDPKIDKIVADAVNSISKI